MNNEILNEKLEKFLSMSPEEKSKIDNDESLDGNIFDILDEITKLLNDD